MGLEPRRRHATPISWAPAMRSTQRAPRRSLRRAVSAIRDLRCRVPPDHGRADGDRRCRCKAGVPELLGELSRPRHSGGGGDLVAPGRMRWRIWARPGCSTGSRPWWRGTTSCAQAAPGALSDGGAAARGGPGRLPRDRGFPIRASALGPRRRYADRDGARHCAADRRYRGALRRRDGQPARCAECGFRAAHDRFSLSSAPLRIFRLAKCPVKAFELTSADPVRRPLCTYAKSL